MWHVSHPNLFYNNAKVSRANSQKHLGVVLGSKLTFLDYLDIVLPKVRKTIGLLHKLNSILPRAALVTIFKVFIGTHLDGDVLLYHQAFDNAFHKNLGSVQCNACLAMAGAIKGTSKGKLHEILGLEDLQLRRCYRKLCSFYNILKNKNSQYLL